MNDFLKRLCDTGSAECRAGAAVGQEQHAPMRTLTLSTSLSWAKKTHHSHTTRLVKLPEELEYIMRWYFELSDKICDWSALKNAEHRHWPQQTASHDSLEPDNCWKSFRRAQSILFSSQTKKLFTIAAPVNLQNDRVYAAKGVKKRDIPAKRLLRTRPTFSKSLMVFSCSVKAWLHWTDFRGA